VTEKDTGVNLLQWVAPGRARRCGVGEGPEIEGGSDSRVLLPRNGTGDPVDPGNTGTSAFIT
jgi:hypothetical protein